MGKPRLTTLKPTLKMASLTRTASVVSSDSWRGDKTTAQRGYGGKWQRARAEFLRANPLCAYCQRDGRVTAATVVDHVIPHRGDDKLFWSRSNWQPLCFSHHNGEKQMLEKSGTQRTKFDANGRVVW